MKILITAFLLMSAVATMFAGGQDSMLKDTTESQFKVGQVWSYKTRPGENDSTFVVVKVESHPKLGNIVHISIRGLKMKKPSGPDDYISQVSHLPISEETLAKSADKLLKEKEELPDYKEGYKLWREAFDNGKAGIWTVSLAEVIQAMEDAMNQ